MADTMMKAVVIDQYGGREQLRLAQMPVPVAKPGEILIRVAAAALNPADWKWREGWFSDHIPLPFPHILGYDVAGSVINGDGFTPGTRIAATLEHIKGGGGYAEYAVARSCDVALLPPDLDFAQAAVIPTPALTGVQMIENALNVQPNQRVLVTGATGAVGRFAMFAAKQRNAHVIAAVRKQHRDAALLMGADEVITLGEDKWNGQPFDMVADTVGGDAVAKLCEKLSATGDIATVSTSPIDAKRLSTQPVFVSVQGDGRQLSQLIAAVHNNSVALPVGKRLRPEETALGHEMLEHGRNRGKIIIHF